jgi:DNA-directed RNA polymerase subunit RPC12/RpoP
MRPEGRERCGRCGADPFAGGEPYTTLIETVSVDGIEVRALHMCVPCGREFPSSRERAEYLRLVTFG